MNIATFHAYGGWSPAYEFGSRGRCGGYADRLHGRIAVSRGRPPLHRPLLPGRLQGHPQRRRRRPLPARRAARALAGRDARTSCSSAGSSRARACSTCSRRTGSCARPAASAGCCSSAAARRSARRGATWRPAGCTASSSWAACRDDEKAQLFRTADVFVSPATGRESFGIVLLEAMAAGRADRGLGHPRLQGRRAARPQGLLVPPARAQGDRRPRSARLLARPRAARAQMSAAGAARAEEFSWPRVTAKVDDYYGFVDPPPRGRRARCRRTSRAEVPPSPRPAAAARPAPSDGRGRGRRATPADGSPTVRPRPAAPAGPAALGPSPGLVAASASAMPPRPRRSRPTTTQAHAPGTPAGSRTAASANEIAPLRSIVFTGNWNA